MMLNRIQSKFNLIAIIALAAVVSLVITSIWATGASETQATRLHLISTVTQRHMEGDMMHDAIRSDVLTGLLARENSDRAAISQAMADLSDHVANFEENIRANQAEDVPTEMSDYFEGAAIALDAYAESARAVLEQTLAGNDTSLVRADFNEKFDAMEEENEQISNAIADWATQTQVRALQIAETTGLITGILSFLTCILVLATPIYAWRSLFAPLRATTGQMEQMASGDYSVEISRTNKKNEIGEIARTLLVFRANGIDKQNADKERLEREARAEEERRRMFKALADQFQARIENILRSVTESTQSLQASTQAMTDDISRASTRAGNVTKATQQATHNVQTVASAAEEMTSSVQEIATQISHSSDAIVSAVSEMQRADDTSRLLGEATQRVGEIVEFIQNITNQINLLALNATIESARAGEAGKGFAVVASEVKTLAGQTSKATEDISESIDNIRSVSQQVIAAIGSIKHAIESVQDISGTISVSIQQQSSATNEIADNMGRVSSENESVSRDISAVSEASAQVSQSAARNLEDVKRLTEHARTLDQEVHKFLQEIRAA